MENKCIKCGGTLTEGFLLDRGHYNGKMKQIWVEGEPEESFWSGIKTTDKAAYYVQAFRCENCKFLEFYTTDKLGAGGGLSELFGG